MSEHFLVMRDSEAYGVSNRAIHATVGRDPVSWAKNLEPYIKALKPRRAYDERTLDRDRA